MFRLKLANGRVVRRRGARKEVIVEVPDEGSAEIVIENGDDAGVVSNLEVVPPVTRRYRAVISRTVTQRAVVEFEAEETVDPYAMTDEILGLVTDADWQTSDPGYGYIESIEPVEAVADPAEEELLEEALEGVVVEVAPEEEAVV